MEPNGRRITRALRRTERRSEGFTVIAAVMRLVNRFPIRHLAPARALDAIRGEATTRTEAVEVSLAREAVATLLGPGRLSVRSAHSFT